MEGRGAQGVCTSPGPGFFLGGGAPLKNGVTGFFWQNTSCISQRLDPLMMGGGKGVCSSPGADPRFFLGGGAPLRNGITNFGRIPLVLESCRSTRGGGGVCTSCTLPLDLPLFPLINVLLLVPALSLAVPTSVLLIYCKILPNVAKFFSTSLRFHYLGNPAYRFVISSLASHTPPARFSSGVLPIIYDIILQQHPSFDYSHDK